MNKIPGMAWLRSALHLLWMALTVVPYALLIVLCALLGVRSLLRYRIAAAWMGLCIAGARLLVGIRTQVTGLENLPQPDAAGGSCGAVVLLVKHQSAYETLLMPTIMPQPLAYVFKRELLRLPFFGWAIGSLDMIHIDRSQGTRALHKVMQQGRALLARGVWVIMFPEGTRIARGQQGSYKAAGARLAIDAGVPVVPIAVASARVWPPKAFVKRPGLVAVSIGRPIASRGRKPDELMREVQAWIEAEMRRLDPDAYARGPDAAQAQDSAADAAQTQRGQEAATPTGAGHDG